MGSQETHAESEAEVEQGHPDCDLPLCEGSPESDVKPARDDGGHGDTIVVCEDCLNDGAAGFVELI